jgi:hypothetical protein
MHMNSDPQHLSSEDRQEYERLLDEALRSAPARPELAAVGQRLNPEQLRTMALSAITLITAAAATEYQHYVKLREELRRPAARPTPVQESVQHGVAGPADADVTDAVDLAESMGQVTETTGAGVVAVVAVLTPVLAGIAAAIFLLVGYSMEMLDPEPAFAKTLLTAGWVFGALTAAAILVAAVGLLLTALRDGSGAEHVDTALDEELTRAREAWREALLERGIVPFFQEALAGDGDAGQLPHRIARTPDSRMPHLGYNRPGFSSRDSTPGSRPRYTSPDYSSPDYGGPEHQPE